MFLVIERQERAAIGEMSTLNYDVVQCMILFIIQKPFTEYQGYAGLYAKCSHISLTQISSWSCELSVLFSFHRLGN